MPNNGVAVRKLWERWKWVAYPVGVGVVIWVSLGWLVGSSDAWQSLTVRQDEVREQQEKVARLKEKLAVMTQVNLGQEKANLGIMVEAIPAVKQVPGLLAELAAAGNAAGAAMAGVRGTAGDVGATESAVAVNSQELVLTASFVVTDIQQVGKLLTDMEKRLPLLRVRRVQFSKGKIDVEVEGVWSPLGKLVGEVDQPLPETKGLAESVKRKLAGFVSLPVVAATSSGSVRENPF